MRGRHSSTAEAPLVLQCSNSETRTNLEELWLEVQQLAARHTRANPQVKAVEAGWSMPRLTAAQVDEVIAAYSSGESMTAIATRYGVHRVTVRRYLDLAGKGRAMPMPISPDQVSQAIDLYHQGLTLKQVAAQLGFTSETIRKYLHRSGVALRAKGQAASRS